MTGALPENPPPARVTRLLDLAARVLAVRDRLATARDAVLASPTRAPVLAALADVLGAEVRGLDELVAATYRLVELAEDSWDDLDRPGTDPDSVPGRAEALARAVEHALVDAARLAGVGAGVTDANGGTSPDTAQIGAAPVGTSAVDTAPVDIAAVVRGWDGAEPEDVYASVEHLPVAARRLLALAEPEAVGSTYGVPWRVRALANSVAVRRALHREQLAGTPWSPRIGRLETMLRRVPDPTAPAGAPAPPVRRAFIAFSAERGGRMTELVGRVDERCEAVGIYVPGTGTNLDMSHVNTDVGVDLVRAGAGRLVVLVFLDGEFPQDIMRDAGDPGYALRLAPRLVRLGREVDRVIGLECPGAVLTVLGHSYGGRVVGRAEHLGLRADRIVYAEAPDLGPGVQGADSLHNPAAVLRYSLTAPADPVELLQIRGGLRHAWTHDDLDGLTVRLDTGYFADGTPVFGTRGHGGVFEAGSGAFRAMLAVLLGGEVPAWRDRGIVARWVSVRRGTDGRAPAAARRALVGLVLRRDDDPYGEARVTWEAPERIVTIPPGPRAQSRK